MGHEQTLEEYAAWLRSWGASQNTIEGRLQTAGVVLGLYGLDGLTAANLQAWMGRRKETGEELTRWSRATYFSNLKCFCSWAFTAELIDADPMIGAKSPTRPKSLPRPLSEAEVATALRVATGNVRDWILLAMLAGLRAHEIAKIRGEDVAIEGIYVEGKGGVRASIPTHPEIWAMAQRHPRTGYWFPGRNGGHVIRGTISTQVGNLFHEHGISGSIHRCRHVYGTRLLRAGVNIRTVQQLMRHASLQTTANYTAVNEDEMRAAIHTLSA